MQKFAELKEKFEVFQKPLDFEAKLSHVANMLNEVEDGLSSIQLSSEDSDVVENQLEKCMVTDSRSHLEKQLRKDDNVEAKVFHFQEWLHSTQLDVNKLTSDQVQIDSTEFQQLQDVLTEIRNKKEMLDSLYEDVKNDTSSKTEDDNSIEQNICHLQNHYSIFEEKLQNFLEDSQEVFDNTRDQFKHFFHSLVKIKNWLESAEHIVSHFQKLSNEQKRLDGNLEKMENLQSEMVNLEQEQKNLVSSAQHLPKTRNQLTIEPELLEVQERWEVLSTKIQNLASSHEINVKRTTVEQLRASPVQLPSSGPGTPRVEEMESKMQDVRQSIEQFAEETSDMTSQSFDTVAELQSLLKVFKEKAIDVENQTKQLNDDWIEYENHGSSDLTSTTRLRKNLHSLQEEWLDVQKFAEAQHIELQEKLTYWLTLEEKKNALTTVLQHLLSKFVSAETGSSAHQLMEAKLENSLKDIESVLAQKLYHEGLQDFARNWITTSRTFSTLKKLQMQAIVAQSPVTEIQTLTNSQEQMEN